MRKLFFQELYKRMAKNNNIWALAGDLGYGGFDNIRKDYPDRFINVGAAEHTMLDIAVGLALEGKTPFVYSITTFLLYRPFEAIRNYINHEKIPVKLIGSGRSKDYAHDGFSHWSQDDKKIMNFFPNITSLWPRKKKEIPSIIDKMINTKKPFYLNLKRS